MATYEQTTPDEFEQLIGGADSGVQTLFGVYEPLEAAYLEAAASRQRFCEVTNATTLQRSIITTTRSAR